MKCKRHVARVGAVIFVMGALVAGLTPAAGQAGDPGKPSVSAAVQVTGDPNPARAHSSPQIAVNPVNGELVIAEGEVRTAKACNVYISVDDGRSWFPGGDPMMKPFTDCTLQATNGHYISMQFDPRGVLWAAFLGSDRKFSTELNRSEIPRHVFLARSEDSGRTWTTARAFEAKEGDPGIGGTRRPLVAVDPRDSRSIYIGWQKGGSSQVKAKSMVSASRDGGRSFAEPVDLSDERGGTQPRVAVDGDGTVHAIFTTNNFGVPSDSTPTRPLLYRQSTDGGRTWSPQKEIDPHNAGFSFGRKSLLTADANSPYLYVTWYGNSNPRARRPPANEPSTNEFDDREIFVRVSPDRGRSWSEARLVNDDAPRPNIQHYDSAISIAPNGRIDIAWYDFRNSPTPEFEGPGGNAGGWQDVYYAYSTDRGRTFSENIRVTDRLIDRNIGVWSNNVHSHTNVGIASTDASAYVTWQDTRNGSGEQQAEDIYFAALKFQEEDGEDNDGVPGWVLFASAAALGMGLTVVVLLAISRRRTAKAADLPGGAVRGTPD